MTRRKTITLDDLQAVEEVARWTAEERGISPCSDEYEDILNEVWDDLKDST